MEAELSQPQKGRKLKPKFKDMVFRWRIGAYQPRQNVRTARHAGSQGTFPLPSPMQVYRMSIDTLLPVPADHLVHQTLDYFFQALAHLFDDGLKLEGHPNPLLSIGFPLSVQHAMLFEAHLAVMRTIRLMIMGLSPQNDLFVLVHRGNALRMLRQRLQLTQAVSDDVLMTVAYLSALEVHLGNLDGLETHMRAVQKMKRLRSGVEDGSPTRQYVTARIKGMEAFALLTLRDRRPHSSMITEIQEQRLMYPTHPFSPALSSKLSSLPDGFIELAMSSLLSFQMIDILERVCKAKNGPESDQSDILQKLRALSGIIIDLKANFPASETTEVEGFLSHGLMGFCLQLDEKKEHSTDQATGVTDRFSSFAKMEAPRPLVHRDGVIWSYLSFAEGASIHDVSYANRIIDSLLSNFPEIRDWKCLEKIIRRFFWTEKTLSHCRSSWEGAIERKSVSMTVSKPTSIEVLERAGRSFLKEEEAG